MSEMSGTDLLSLANNIKDDGNFMGGSGGIWIFLVLILLLGNGNWNGNNYYNNAISRADVQEIVNDSQTQQMIGNGFASTNQALCCGFAGVNQNINSGFSDTALAMNTGFNSVNQNLNSIGFNMQQCCCQLKEAIHQDGEATRSLMQQNLIQDLRDKLADSKAETFATGLTTAQVIQTNTLENFIRQILTPATPAATT